MPVVDRSQGPKRRIQDVRSFLRTLVQTIPSGFYTVGVPSLELAGLPLMRHGSWVVLATMTPLALCSGHRMLGHERYALQKPKPSFHPRASTIQVSGRKDRQESRRKMTLPSRAPEAFARFRSGSPPPSAGASLASMKIRCQTWVRGDGGGRAEISSRRVFLENTISGISDPIGGEIFHTHCF